MFDSHKDSEAQIETGREHSLAQSMSVRFDMQELHSFFDAFVPLDVPSPGQPVSDDEQE